MWPGHPTPRRMPNRNDSPCPETCGWVFATMLRTAEKQKPPTCPENDERIQNVIYAFKGVPLGYKREAKSWDVVWYRWTLNTSRWVRESGTTGRTAPHDSTPRGRPEQATPWQEKVGGRLPRGGSAGGPEGGGVRREGLSFRAMKTFWNLTVVIAGQQG